MKPTGRANARPMTGSAKSGNLNRGPRISLALHPGYKFVDRYGGRSRAAIQASTR
jgi:hypothetical protein